MKDRKETKSVKISKDVHADLKVHVAIKQVGMTDFLDKAVRNQLKRESK
jgi:hypothetical protein